MAKFKIIQKDPTPFKHKILQMWKENLPGTPPGRFEWMNDNPAGQPIWYLAFHTKTGQLAGTVSILPRAIFVNGNRVLAGIVGDFMVEKTFRVFGPGLQLQKAIIASFPELGFQFLYTITNKASEKLMLRAGFRECASLTHFVKPIKLMNQLEKHISSRLSKLIAPGLELGLRLVCRETYSRRKGNFQEIAKFDHGHDLFFKELESDFPIIGARRCEDLNWRLFKNPIYDFCVLSFSNSSRNSMLGYIAYVMHNKDAFIYDIIARDGDDFRRLLSQFLMFGRENGYFSISINVLTSNPFIRYMASFGFHKRHEFSLLYAGDSELLSKKWLFFSGDRNI